LVNLGHSPSLRFTMQVNIYEAKTRLSALLDEAARGREVIIARAGKPVARLQPITPARGGASRSGVRFGGLEAKRLRLAADFHEPLSDADLIGR
jgi:prevent-host-death family protein